MGLFFRRSFKIAPGIRLNVSKRGFGVSAGVRGARISRSATGRTTVSTGIPGTGISYRESVGGHSRRSTNTTAEHEAVTHTSNPGLAVPAAIEHLRRVRDSVSPETAVAVDAAIEALGNEPTS